jgi:isoleucyl-tRNA synthetase
VELRKKNVSDWTIILAEARAGAVLGADYTDRWDSSVRSKGSELVGMRYKRPLDWVAYPEEGVHEVIVGEEFVTADDGSGVVHMAPAFGADDYAAGSVTARLREPGECARRVPREHAARGWQVREGRRRADHRGAQRRDQLWKAQKFVHSYPHCWRCGTPLLYYARVELVRAHDGVRTR